LAFKVGETTKKLLVVTPISGSTVNINDSAHGTAGTGSEEREGD
jgi:hypothetical protein